ncbi:MAG: GNAT family N-acetyltransferase [Ignavibacteria bacterium]|nr:GNAT family N-acetyltransferase [Ignavibacteria bacterium]
MNYTGNIYIQKSDIYTDKEWNNILSSNYNLFFDPVFLKYNDEFSKNIVWHNLIIKSKKKSRNLGIITGCEILSGKEKIFVSCRGTSFGGFLWKEKLSVINYTEAINIFSDYLKDNGFTFCTLNNPPNLYNSDFNEEYEYSLLENGFKITKDSITNIIKLQFFEYIKLSNPLKRTIRNSAKNVTISIIDNPIDSNKYERFYDILLQNRLTKNIKPTHSKEELIYLKRNLSGRIIFFSAEVENVMCGICVLFIIKNDVILNFYLATDENFKKYRVADYLLFKTIEWAKNNNYRLYDIGTSDVGGKLIEGLFNFKKKFKADGFLRKSFSKKL